jgi:hypothetical protein
MPIYYTDPEMEILYDRLASYARVLKSLQLVVKFNAFPWSDDFLELLNSKLEYEGVNIDDVSIDCNVSGIRNSNSPKGA